MPARSAETCATCGGALTHGRCTARQCPDARRRALVPCPACDPEEASLVEPGRVCSECHRRGRGVDVGSLALDAGVRPPTRRPALGRETWPDRWRRG